MISLITVVTEFIVEVIAAWMTELVVAFVVEWITEVVTVAIAEWATELLTELMSLLKIDRFSLQQ